MDEEKKEVLSEETEETSEKTSELQEFLGNESLPVKADESLEAKPEEAPVVVPPPPLPPPPPRPPPPLPSPPLASTPIPPIPVSLESTSTSPPTSLESLASPQTVPLPELSMKERFHSFIQGSLFEEVEMPSELYESEKLWQEEEEDEEEDFLEPLEEVDEAEAQRRLETLLFHWSEPLSLAKIKDCLNFKGSNYELREMILRLQRKILEQNHGFELLEVANGFIFKSKAKYVPYIRKLSRTKLPYRPSQAVLETLAIIAYKQPVRRAVIEEIRGVKVSPILNALLEKNLIREVGRANSVGHPKLYGTTEEFLALFGFDSLADLPLPEQQPKL
jgi:segregation and condensation protein B